MKKETILMISLCFIFLVLGFVYGVYNGYYAATDIQKAKDITLLNKTCSLANDVIDLNNNANILLNNCYNETLPILTKLKCESIQ